MYDRTHAVENVTYIATVAVVRPRVSIWCENIHTLACSSVARKKEKFDLQTQCVIYVSYPLLRISLYTDKILYIIQDFVIYVAKQNSCQIVKLNKIMPLYQLWGIFKCWRILL